MENKNTPAHPTEVSMDNKGDGFHQNGNTTALFHGLSKRELIAAMAMQGILSDGSHEFTTRHTKMIAELATAHADALLVELANSI